MIAFRKALVEDADLLAASRIDFLMEFWGKKDVNEVRVLHENLREVFHDLLQKNLFICYLAFDESIFAGMGGMMIRVQPGNFKNPSGRVAYIMNMFTVPEYRKMGIGSSILQLLEVDAGILGIRMLELHATHEGKPLYIKHFFKLHPEPTYRKYI